jgi:hypothetical protein
MKYVHICIFMINVCMCMDSWIRKSSIGIYMCIIYIHVIYICTYVCIGYNAPCTPISYLRGRDGDMHGDSSNSDKGLLNFTFIVGPPGTGNSLMLLCICIHVSMYI